MEALTAVSVACLTIYDMTKALSHDIQIESIQLMSKTGGKRDFASINRYVIIQCEPLILMI